MKPNSHRSRRAAQSAGFSLSLLFVASLLASLLLVLPSCGKSADDSLPQLYIISPHGSDIRYEFARRFSQWHLKKYGTAVKIRWPDIGGGGTGNIIRQLDGDYAHGSSCGYDLAFGGGSASFEQFREHGYLVKPPLPDSVLDAVPQNIFGAPLHGKGNTWIAATMSNFGIVYNKDRLHELGLETPWVWVDLAGPKWFKNLSLADPSKSGSVRTAYDQVFLQYGWDKGWGILTRMFANTDNLRDSGSAPADDVGSAQAVAGVAIDFYGRKEVLRVGENLVGFLIPRGGSITDADPIAMLKGAPHPELAAHFIEFVISEAGQKLWTFKANTPGGPQHYVLGRLSVLPQIYEKYPQYLQDTMDPFTAAEPLKADDKASIIRSTFLGDLMKASLVDNHDLLESARRAILAAGDPPDLLAKLDAVPHFIPTKVVGDNVVDEPSRPITADQQAAVAAEFKPPAPLKTDSPEVAHAKTVKRADASILQTRLIDGWRDEYRTRLESLRSEAEARRKQ